MGTYVVAYGRAAALDVGWAVTCAVAFGVGCAVTPGVAADRSMQAPAQAG